MANPVEQAHPFVQFTPGAATVNGRRVLLVKAERDRRPDEHEHLDALPVEEQAAIVLSICACGLLSTAAAADEIGADRRASNLAHVQSQYARWDCGDLHRHAEAEARIRTGQVR